MTTVEAETIRQMSIELAARQRDLLEIHNIAATDAPPRDLERAIRMLDDIAGIADPDGWADGTSDEAELTTADNPDCGWATSSSAGSVGGLFREDTP